MMSIVAREVDFGMAGEQRAIEIVVSVDISHSGIYLNTPDFFAFCSTVLVVRLDAPLERCLKSALNSTQRAGIE